MKTYRVTVYQEYGMGLTRVQATDELVAAALAAVRLYEKDEGRITRVEVEEM